MSKNDTSMYSIDGINKVNAKRFTKFIFKDSLIEVKKNLNKRQWDIIVKNTVDGKVVKDLMKEFIAFNVIVASYKQVQE